MIVVDITRLDKNNKENDLLIGNISIDTKNKVINYIYDYSLANLNIDVDKELLDYKLNMESFSLKDFLLENYNITTDKDLIIHSAKTDKDHCLFLKFDNDIVTLFSKCFLMIFKFFLFVYNQFEVTNYVK